MYLHILLTARRVVAVSYGFYVLLNRGSKITSHRFSSPTRKEEWYVCRDSRCGTRRGSRQCMAGTTCFRSLSLQPTAAAVVTRGNPVQPRYPAIALPLHRCRCATPSSCDFVIADIRNTALIDDANAFV